MAAIDAALDEVRHHHLVEGEWVRNLLLDLRAQAAMLDVVVAVLDDLAGTGPTLPDLSN